MTLADLETRFAALGEGYKTAGLDRLNRQLIKEGADVSFLRDIVLSRQEFHRTYFQVSMGQMKSDEEKLAFIEDNFYLLNDWWHVDQLTQFLSKNPNFELCLNSAEKYVRHSHPFARRWGYVLLCPTP